MLQQLEASLRQLPWLQDVDLSNAQLWLFAAGLLLGLLGLLKVLRKRRLRAGLFSLVAAFLLVLTVMLYAIGQQQFESYLPLLPEREVLQISFLEPASVDKPVTRMQLMPLDESGKRGTWDFDADYWQISVRVIYWRGHGWYRWRLLLRNDSPEAGKAQRAYRLMRSPSPDLWERVYDYLDWVPGLEAQRLTSEPATARVGSTYRVALLKDRIQVTPVEGGRPVQLDSDQ